MKLKTIFLLILTTITIKNYSQIVDLAKISSGKIIFSTTLYDSKSHIYGYIYIYEKDQVDKEHKLLEYVLFDKNLNPVTNMDFKEKLYKKVKSKFYDCTLMGDNLFLNKYYTYSSFDNSASPLLSTFQIISLKNNTVSEEFMYENEKLVSFNADFDNMKSEYKGSGTKSVIYTFNVKDFKGFIVDDRNINKHYYEKEFRFFNVDKENVWSFEYNPNPSNSKFTTYSLLHTQDSSLYVGLSKLKLKAVSTSSPYKSIEYKINSIDIKTGKLNYEYVLDKTNSDTVHFSSFKNINNKLIITGLYGNSNYKNNITFINSYLGMYRLILDDKGQIIEKKYYNWSSFSDKITISTKGSIDGYYLDPLDYFIFQDGSISILTVGKKAPAVGESYLYKDYILFCFDKNFNITKIHNISKKLPDGDNGFLFSQLLNNEESVAFFDKFIQLNPVTNKKEKYLGINKIVNGNYTYEKILLSNISKNDIDIFPAKEGYVMFQEFNEKEKIYNVRLESINL